MSSTKPPADATGGKAAAQGEGEGEGERYPVEEVALGVPETDDPATPVMTFRAWTLGLASCVVLIFLNTFFTYRTQPLTISGILAQILVLPVGRFMASVLPDRKVRLLGGRLGSFNLNPGPFNIKEHVIITIFANCGVSYGGGDAYSIGAITVMKAYYKQSLSFLCALLIVLSTQILGYGWAGMLRRFLVDPAEMWWPSNLAQVSLFSPLVAPWASIANTAVGFVMFIYVIVPLCYWRFNTFDARRFPIFSNQLFTSTGQKYDTTKVLTADFDLNVAAYDSYGKLYLSPLFAISIGSGFLRFSATIVHVLLFHGADMWRQSRRAIGAAAKLDVHARLMQRYKQVPQWWFLVLLAGSIAVSLLMCFVWKEQVQLPWWGMLFAFALAFVVTLPIGVIQATTNQFMIGYALPGKPIANLLFKIYGRISTVHALSFLADLKLGHYMKIPPRCMYTAQLVGTVVAGVVNLAVAWWMLDSIDNICDVEALHPDSPWTCPKCRKGWWQKYNYVLSAALDAGTAFMGVLIFFALQNAHHDLKWWGTEVDHCPLATCPTAPGIVVKGCPVF
ncbi:Oligopeptide transporter 3 [Triticum urartu]|uniref:Oligopeptide transporter 3 n=1 Tax=Triticum urartu TaxID=4572 RepID=M7YEN5_TRIUA|nr:Oligopeptide transporter 3 [Triticum urartu]